VQTAPQECVVRGFTTTGVNAWDCGEPLQQLNTHIWQSVSDWFDLAL